MVASKRQVYIGRYAGKKKSEFYREKEGVILVDTEIGTIWVPIAVTGSKRYKFDPESELVIVFLMEPDAPTSSRADDSSVYYTPFVFGLIVSVPPQLIKAIMPIKDEANMPTKIMGGSDSEDDERVTLGVSEDAKVVVTNDMVCVKSGGGQMAFCKDAIVKRGNLVDMSFFSESKGGILKQNWLGHIIPQSVVTPFPSYIIDSNILKRIGDLAKTISSIRG